MGSLHKQRSTWIVLACLLLTTWVATAWNAYQATRIVKAFNVALPPLAQLAFHVTQPQIATLLTLLLLSLIVGFANGNRVGVWFGLAIAFGFLLLNLGILMPFMALRNQLSISPPPAEPASIYPSLCVLYWNFLVLAAFAWTLFRSRTRQAH